MLIINELDESVICRRKIVNLVLDSLQQEAGCTYKSAKVSVFSKACHLLWGRITLSDFLFSSPLSTLPHTLHFSRACTEVFYIKNWPDNPERSSSKWNWSHCRLVERVEIQEHLRHDILSSMKVKARGGDKPKNHLLQGSKEELLSEKSSKVSSGV